MKPMNSPTPTVVLPALHGAQAAAWEALLEVAPDFGEGWTLVGGQMVMLHQAERQPSGSTMSGRWSHDLDVVVNIRTGRFQAAHMDEALKRHGFDQVPTEIEHRYLRDSDGVVIDVLAPDHLGRHLPRLGRGHTVQTPGGTQALRRTERVAVEYRSRSVLIPRPSLVGAILMKIAASARPGGQRGSQRHQHDVWALAALLRDDDASSTSLSRKERRRIERAADQMRGHGDPLAALAATHLQHLLDAYS